MADDFALTVGSIARIKTIAERDETQETFNVRVLGVYRYTVDKSFPIPSSGLTYAFDILITDGRYKTKCLLSPTLNFLVYEHKLRDSAIIAVTECRSLIDEESLEQVPLVILQGIEVLNSAPATTLDRDGASTDLEFCTNSTANEKQEIPLAAARGYYLPLWNEEDYFGSIWLSNPDLSPSKPIANAITISDLDAFWRTLPRPLPALIGTIVSKTRLNHYGKSSDDKRRYPYQFYLELEDRTATVSVCIWNSLCLLLYNYLQVGDVVAILNYRVSRRFGSRSNAVYNTSDAVMTEISLNPLNPVAQVYKISPEEVVPDWRLPSVPYRFIDRKSLSSYSSGIICDIVGTVMFVSREIQERKGVSSSHWTSKWVHLRDGSSSLPIILHLYACSQPEVFNSIAAGNVLVCARMLLKVECQDSKQARICFLTTSRESQLYALKKPSDANNKPFSDSTEIADAIKWRQSGVAKQLLMVSCSGGYYSFPPLNHSLELYKRTFPQGSEMSLITTVNLGFVMKELHYREQLRLHIQGIVVAMEFVPTAGSVGSAPDGTTQMSSSQLGETQRSDKHSQEASSQLSLSQSSCHASRNSTLLPEKQKVTCQIAVGQESESKGSSSQINQKNHQAKSKQSRVQTRSAGKLEESASDSEQSSAGSSGSVKRRVNPKRKCKKSIKLKESSCDNEGSSAGSSGAVKWRINPKRKCKKVNETNRNVCIKRTSRHDGQDLPKKVSKKEPTPKNKRTVRVKPKKKVKTRRGGQRSSRPVEEERGATDSEEITSTSSSKGDNYFPFRILDDTCPNMPEDTPVVGLSRPSCHENTFPRLCSRGLSDVRVVPTADRQGFVNSEGYWRLMITGLNRRAIINAIFMPQTPEKTEGDLEEEPEDGFFLSALATGSFSRWYPVETILNRANEELRGRRTVFVLDIYNHGEGKVEIVINRGY